MLKPGGNPNAPLRRGKKTALVSVYTQYTTDGVRELHPIMPMARRPRARPQAFSAAVARYRVQEFRGAPHVVRLTALIGLMSQDVS